MVSGTAAGARGGGVHGGRAAVNRHRFADLRRADADPDDRWPEGLAMAFHHRSDSRDRAWLLRAENADGFARQGQLARQRRKAWLINTLREERASRQAEAGHAEGALHALRDPRVWVLALIYFGTSAGLYTLGLWAPLIIRQFGFSALGTGALNAIPSVLAVIGMVLWARHSDRTGERTWHVVIPCVAAGIGLAFAGIAQRAFEVVLALVVVNVGISAAKAPLWAMPSTFLSGAGAAAGIAMINSIGNLGGFIGPFAIGWLKSVTGGYAAGLYVVAGSLAVSAMLTLMIGRRGYRAAAVTR